MSKIPKIVKNFYFIAAVFFLVWMFFIDSNDFNSQFKLSGKLNKLESEKKFYLERIEEVSKDREELINNPHLIEKFARERYLMKKNEEDLYIIEEE